MKEVPSQHRAALARTVLGARAEEALSDYYRWLRDCLAPWGLELVPEYRFEPEEGFSMAEIEGLSAGPKLWREAMRDVFPVLEWLYRRPQYRSLLRSATATWRRAGHGDGRILVALVRVLDPLAASDETRGIERSWQELHETEELEEYLKHALRAQSVFLRRSPDLRRAQQVTGQALHRETKRVR